MRITRACLAAALATIVLLTRVSLATQESRAETPDADHSEVIRLWSGDAPGAKGADPADIPTLTIFRPTSPAANGAAVIVCPGGGYSGLAAHEGKPVAQWLNTLGVTSFVLKYRLGPKYHHPAMLQDVSRAVRMVRSSATQWQLDPSRIGVIGFSAGGHLVSTAVTHFDAGDAYAQDAVDRVSSRPDFGILVYPVITLSGPYAHAGSRRNLLGDHPSDELVDSLSSEKQVRDDTPPCFLVHTSTDKVVPFQNSLMFAEALRLHHVPVELHVFDHGAHGFGLGGKDPVLSQWPGLCAKWMGYHGWLSPGGESRATTSERKSKP
ncbi:MAG TPA: alpha/beta hydrolase [Tepidisphaeraceae bacterium]|nr:alpha/beta hydrolase [Tepidisphaeraceae bacterium]